MQLWVVLPDAVRNTTAPDFTHIADLPTYEEAGVSVKVLVGELVGETSSAPAFTPLVGAEIRLAPGASGTIPLERGFEYGVLTAQGAATVAGRPIAANEMSYLGEGRSELTVSAAEHEAVILLLGGEPFAEEIVMWWNFIARSHEELVEQREAWNGDGVDWVPERFGQVSSFDGDRLLAPPMPNTRLKPRGRVSA